MKEKREKLSDMSFEELVDFGVTEIVQEVLGGKKPLRSAMFWVIDVATRWGAERKQNELQIPKRRK